MAEAVVVADVSGGPVGDAVGRGSASAVVAEFFAMVSRCLAIAAGFVLPISTAATEAVLLTLLPCWLLSGKYTQKLQMIRSSKPVVLGLAIFGLYAIGVAYSTAPLGESVAALLEYRKLLYLMVFLTVFAHWRARETAIAAFQIAMLVTLGASFLMSWGLVQSKWGGPSDCAVFKNHVAQNILMAFFVATLADAAYRNRRLRWLYVGVMLLAVYNVLFMVGGRTGYLILFALVCWLMFQRGGMRGLAAAVALVVCLGAAVYGCSSGFRQRVNLAVQEAADYYYYQRDSIDSSIGQRLLFYRTSLAIALRNPVFGVGTGSFRVEFQKLPENEGKQPTANPHSEYFSVLIQTGLLGLGLFLYWLYSQWVESKRLPPQLAFLVRALLVTLVVGSLFNSMIATHTEGWLYCYFAGLCYAGCAGVLPAVPESGQRLSSRAVPLARESVSVGV